MKGKLVFILFLFPLSVVSAMRFPADHRASSLGIGQQQQQQQQQSMNRLLQNEEESDEKTENEHLKPLKICSVLGGLDLTRLRSSEARSLFKGTIEDVELIREYVSEAITNGGLKGGLSDLQDLRNTLDWEARGLDPSLDTLTAGLGYSDDRIDRRIDRMTSSSSNLPFVGNKETDAVMMDVVSNILPWIVDRKKNEDLWFLDHQNGRNQMPGSEPLVYESLYMQAYILSWGDSIWYYPPLSQYGHPLQIADALGGGFDSHPIVKGAGFLPDENPQHLSAFYGPYPDIGIPGLALITATTPVYFTGEFMNFTYNDTYIAHAGLDIPLDSISATFEDLKDSLVDGSFALLVNTTLSPIAISQSVVEKIYPQLTGFEEARVTYSTADGSLVDDRRNQTYLVSDTIHQSLTQNVPSAKWKSLEESIQKVVMGDRGYMLLNLTLTGSTEEVPYYIMYDRWEYVSDWVLLVLAPVEGVDNAISVHFSENQVELEAGVGNEEVPGSLMLSNSGTLDVRIEPSFWPSWLEFQGETTALVGSPITLARGASIEIEFVLKSENLEPGTSISTVAFRVQDDGYADCFYDRDVTFDAVLRVKPAADRNLIGSARIAGYILMAIVITSAVGFISWIFCHFKERIVRGSQPRFLVMLSVGTIIMALAIVTMSIDDDNASSEAADKACMATPWLASMGFIISFSALFSKIWRVTKIFQNPQFRRITVTETDVLVPFAVLFTLNFALLLAWTLVDPFRYERVPVDGANPFNTYGACRFENDSTIGFAIGVLVVNFGAILLACIEAYRARRISDEFSESKWVGITIVSWLQVVVVGMPVMFLVKENPMATYMLETTMIFVVCMSLLLFIFVPKIIFHRRSKKNSQHRSSNFGRGSIKVYGPAFSQGSADHPSTDNSYSRRGSTKGLGIQILSSPAIEEELRAHIRKLEEKIGGLENQNLMLKAIGAKEKTDDAPSQIISMPVDTGDPDFSKLSQSEKSDGLEMEKAE